MGDGPLRAAFFHVCRGESSYAQVIRMNGFTHLSVDGFRRLCGIELELRPQSPCVMIGANGSGKTSLLEVFSLLSASVLGKLDERISDLSGVAAIQTAGYPADIVCEIAGNQDPDGVEVYRLDVAPSGTAYTDKSGFRPLKRFRYTEREDFKKRLASLILYHILDVGPRSRIRLPQPMRPAKLPGKDGEDLITCLYDMRETDRDRFDAVQDALRAAFPGFERLDFPPVAAGTLSMIWRDRRFREGFYPHQLSEGTLRFLWLAALLQSPGLPAITLIDEPEVSLHPELLSILAELLREASLRSQIFVATHSDRLVRFLQPKEVLVFDLGDDGLAKITWADQLDLDQWLDEYSLDEVWQMGRLGGRA